MIFTIFMTPIFSSAIDDDTLPDAVAEVPLEKVSQKQTTGISVVPIELSTAQKSLSTALMQVNEFAIVNLAEGLLSIQREELLPLLTIKFVNYEIAMGPISLINKSIENATKVRSDLLARHKEILKTLNSFFN
jgi:hypothetical protein